MKLAKVEFLSATIGRNVIKVDIEAARVQAVVTRVGSRIKRTFTCHRDVGDEDECQQKGDLLVLYVGSVVACFVLCV